MNLSRAATLILCTAISGCASVGPIAPTLEQLQSADYGAEPVTYKEGVQQFFDATLKDPSSIQYREVTVPEKGYMQTHSMMGGTKINYGWLVKATVNAKNTYGGYVGFRTYSFLFRGSQIVDTMNPDTQ